MRSQYERWLVFEVALVNATLAERADVQRLRQRVNVKLGCQIPSGLKARKVLFWAAVVAVICIVAWVVILCEGIEPGKLRVGDGHGYSNSRN